MINYLKIGAGLTSALAMAALIYLAVDRFDQKAKADAAKECNEAAILGDENTRFKPLQDCLPNIKLRIGEARAANSCDLVLRRSDANANRFTIRMTCTSGVKRLFAAHEAALDAQEDAERRAAAQAERTSAAVERAERRATQSNQRKDDAQKIITKAPRVVDDLIECDADCLRVIIGSAADSN